MCSLNLCVKLTREKISQHRTRVTFLSQKAKSVGEVDILEQILVSFISG